MTPELKARLAELSLVPASKPTTIRLKVRGVEPDDAEEVVAPRPRREPKYVDPIHRQPGVRRYHSAVLTVDQELELLTLSEPDMAIARRYGIAPKTVVNVRNHYGVPKPPRKTKHEIMREQSHARKLEAEAKKAQRNRDICAAKGSAEEVGARFGLSDHAVWRIWREADRDSPTNRGRPRPTPEPA